MFCCGVYGFITRKNMIAMLVSLELMLNAVDINFVVFNRFLYPEQMEGMFFTLFAIASRSRDCTRYRYHYQHLPSRQEHRRALA